MARVRGRDTTPELVLRKALWHRGHRYRVNYPVVGVKADIVFRGKRVAVFVDGCFWHGCPVHYRPPRSNLPFWANKLRENVERDRRQHAAMRKVGWTALRFWQHEVEGDLAAVVSEVEGVLSGTVEPRKHSPRVISATGSEVGLSRDLVTLRLED